MTRLPTILGADRVFVAQRSSDQKRLIVTHESDGCEPALLGLSQPISQMPRAFVDSFSKGQHVVIDDLARFPLTDRQVRSLRFTNVGALIFVPFAVERTIFGIICVDVLGKSCKWEEEALQAVRRIASAIGQSIALGRRGGSNLARLIADQKSVAPGVDAVRAELRNIYGLQSIDVHIYQGHQRTQSLAKIASFPILAS